MMRRRTEDERRMEPCRGATCQLRRLPAEGQEIRATRGVDSPMQLKESGEGPTAHPSSTRAGPNDGCCLHQPVEEQPGLPEGWKTHDYAVKEGIVRQIIKEFGIEDPDVDAFATIENRRFPRYWDRQMDAFAQDWSRPRCLWINLPFECLDLIVNKIQMDMAKAVLIVPEWKEKSWWKRLQQIVVQSLQLPGGTGIFLQRGKRAMRAPKWKTWAFLVDGRKAQPVHRVYQIMKR